MHWGSYSLEETGWTVQQRPWSPQLLKGIRWLQEENRWTWDFGETSIPLPQIPGTLEIAFIRGEYIYMKIKVSVAQLCLTFRDPMDCSPSGSSIHGILQAWILEWVAMPFSRESSWPRDFPGDPDGKDSACNVGDWGSMPESGRFLPRNTHGERNLAGDSAWVCKEQDTAEWLTPSFPCAVLCAYSLNCVWLFTYVRITVHISLYVCVLLNPFAVYLKLL